MQVDRSALTRKPADMQGPCTPGTTAPFLLALEGLFRSSTAIDLRPTAPPSGEARAATLTEQVARMRAALALVDRGGSTLRRIGTTLDRYEHAMNRWQALPPTPVQREALLDQVRDLEEELAVALLTASPAPEKPPSAPPPSGPVPRSEAITQKLELADDEI